MLLGHFAAGFAATEFRLAPSSSRLEGRDTVGHWAWGIGLAGAILLGLASGALATSEIPPDDRDVCSATVYWDGSWEGCEWVWHSTEMGGGRCRSAR